MILSTGKSESACKLTDSVLLQEERIAFDLYKVAYRNTMSYKNDEEFSVALGHELRAFNKWRDLYDERVKREENKKVKK